MGGWTTHVAGNRVVGAVPPVPDIFTSTPGEWVSASKAQHEFLRNAERVTIGLPSDSKFFNDETLEDFKSRVESLIAEGYRVPDYVLKSIDEELADLRSECFEPEGASVASVSTPKWDAPGEGE